MTDNNSKPKTVEDYIHEARMYGDTPKDQFGHQFKLLFHLQNPPKTQMDLLPPDALLGHIKDSKTLSFFQAEIVLLNRFFDMGTRSEGIKELFDSLFYSWWQSLRMTGALGGTERWLQSFLEPVSVPYESFSFLQKQKMKKQAKKQKGLRGYLEGMTGQGNEGGGNIYE